MTEPAHDASQFIPSRRPPRVWPVFALLVVALGAGYLASAVVLSIVAAWGEGSAAESQGGFAGPGFGLTLSGLLAATCTVALIELMIVWAATRASTVPARLRLRLGPSVAGPGLLAASAGAMVLLSFGLDSLIHLVGLSGRGVLGLVKEIFSDVSPRELIAAAVILGLIVSTAEEILFRGYMQTRLSRRWGPRAGVIVTSLCFGLAHLDPVQGAGAVALGLYLGALTEWAGSIRPAILCHAVNNIFGTAAPAILGVSEGPGARAGGVALVAVSLAVLLPWIRRRYRKEAVAWHPG